MSQSRPACSKCVNYKEDVVEVKPEPCDGCITEGCNRAEEIRVRECTLRTEADQPVDALKMVDKCMLVDDKMYWYRIAIKDRDVRISEALGHIENLLTDGGLHDRDQARQFLRRVAKSAKKAKGVKT